ncbi:MAG: sulfatase-like hydrolase/transferase, partial [Planctomycetota bacterium]
FTDYAIQFLEEGASANQPVFLYVAYTAPHWPLQAPDDVIAKFRGRYAAGWQRIREARFQRQMEMGMFPRNTRLSPQDTKATAWSKVKDPEEIDLRMATHAAMVHLIDEGVGRIVSKLKQMDQLDNTLILFLSDNGASAESGSTGFTGNRGGDPSARTGTPDSYNSFGISGANMCDTPFRKYKMFVHEGGIATPLIAHWPRVIPSALKGHFSNEVSHVIDLLPTCAKVAGVTYPDVFDGSSITPVAGRSLLPALTGKRLERPEGLFFEHQGNAAVRDGNWKLVRTHRKPWSLYDLAADRTELQDVSSDHPELTLELKKKWQTWAEQAGVQPWPIKKK